MTLSGRFQVVDSRFGKVSVIRRRDDTIANTEKGSYPTLSHLCRVEAQKMAITLMRTGQFTRTGKLDQALANELLCAVLKNEASLDHFVQCLNQELTSKKATYSVSIRIDSRAAGPGRESFRAFIVDVYDFVGVRVDGFAHRLDTGRAISLHPARRWFHGWA